MRTALLFGFLFKHASDFEDCIKCSYILKQVTNKCYVACTLIETQVWNEVAAGYINTLLPAFRFIYMTQSWVKSIKLKYHLRLMD